MVIVVMGPAGAGKTTVGRRLAAALGWPFHDADEFHSPENVARMARGEPLDDAARGPWLAAIRARIDAYTAKGRSAVLTCSALREAYRRVLTAGAPAVRLVYLTGDEATLRARLARRQGHFMRPEMLASQLATLEPPAGVHTFDVAAASPDEIVAAIRRALAV